MFYYNVYLSVKKNETKPVIMSNAGDSTNGDIALKKVMSLPDPMVIKKHTF